MDYNTHAAIAIDAVYEALSNDDVAKTAEMYAGSLFVTCNAYAAAKIQTALMENLKCGVIVSKVGPQYAFDFTE